MRAQQKNTKKEVDKMKFQECYDIIKAKFEGMDMSKVDKDFSAVVNITGKDPGTVYAAWIGRKKIIEPTKHDKATVFVTLSDTTFEELLQKKTDPFKAFTAGKVKAKGNIFVALSVYKKIKK